MIHLVDYYTTFARLAGVDVRHTGPVGFDADGVDQWPALVATARGETSHHPRNEVVLDLDPKRKRGGIVALRNGNYKIMYGAVALDGEATVIADKDWPCSSCCPLRRTYPLHPNQGECTAEAINATLEMWSGDLNMGRNNDGACVDEEHPCVFDVVKDVNESTNLAKDPRYANVVSALKERIQIHLKMYFNQSIDYAKGVTPEQYCAIVKKDNWVQPFVN